MTILISIIGGLLAAGIVIGGLCLACGCRCADEAAEELRRLRGEERTERTERTAGADQGNGGGR